MKRPWALVYGVVAYAIFLATFLYLIGFVVDLVVPRSVDRAPGATSTLAAVLIDIGLIALFGLQHSLMARPGFKRWWTRFVPAPFERSTYVLVSCAVFAVMFWQWRALPAPVWDLAGSAVAPLAYAVCGLGWVLVLASTFVIDHFDLFGLRQSSSHAFGRPYGPPRFRERLLYRGVRHPLMLGFLIAFWATPTMTEGHLLFAVAFTGYVLIAIRIEERDLLSVHGDTYADYRRRVPMLLPVPRRSPADRQRTGVA